MVDSAKLDVHKHTVPPMAEHTADPVGMAMVLAIVVVAVGVLAFLIITM